MTRPKNVRSRTASPRMHFSHPVCGIDSRAVVTSISMRPTANSSKSGSRISGHRSASGSDSQRPAKSSPTVTRYRAFGKVGAQDHEDLPIFDSWVLHATDFPHLTETTARPRTPHPRHRTRFFRSSTLRGGSSPSRASNVGVSKAVCEHAAQSILTKSPGVRSSILAA